MFRDGVARLLVFRVGAERFGLPLDAVHEVMEAPALQRLPDAPPALLGLAALRGELVMVYDAMRLLQASGESASGRTLLLFARGGRRVGVAVDDVLDAVTVEEREVYAVPGADAADHTLVGLVRRGAELIAILDAVALVDLAIAAVAAVGGASA